VSNYIKFQYSLRRKPIPDRDDEIEAMTTDTGDTPKEPGCLMLCLHCFRVLARMKTAAGRREGPEPKLFSYPARTDTWVGPHHTDDTSLVDSVNSGCYICSTLHDAIPREYRGRARYSRSFYEICASGEQRWTLRLTIELGGPDARIRVIECHGIFKILPINGL
jgi:hypothetical protein